jgi:hypothetical protein
MLPRGGLRREDHPPFNPRSDAKAQDSPAGRIGVVDTGSLDSFTTGRGQKGMVSGREESCMPRPVRGSGLFSPGSTFEKECWGEGSGASLLGGVRYVEASRDSKEEKVSRRSLSVVTQTCNGREPRGRAGPGLSKTGIRCRDAGLRQWLYATKPVFARLNDSLAEAFDAAEEVRLVLDLGDFRPGDIQLEISPERYFIAAKHNSMSFSREIPQPEAVDVSMK